MASKKLFKKCAILFTFISMLFISCKDLFTPANFVNANTKQICTDNLVTPYMNISTARSMQLSVVENPNIIDWRVSRFFAILQKIDFESVYPWHGASISKYPVVIYHADNNTPRYYEFRVIKNGEELGSITCNASKTEGEPIAYVSTMTHQVTMETAQKLGDISSDVKLTAVNYPSQFVMRESDVNSRSIINGDVQFNDALTGEALSENSIFIEKSMLELLSEADEKTLYKLEISENDKTELMAEAEEQSFDMKSLWASIDEITSQILATTDEEIECEYQNSDAIVEDASRHIYASETTTVQKKMLDDWYNVREWGNPSCYCGPAAVAYIVLGLGNKSGFTNISLDTLNWNKIKQLYNFFENTIGTGPKVISSLSKGLSSHTNYMIEQKLCHRWNDVNNHLNNYNLPVVSLRSGWYGDWGFHYRVIIGTETERKRNYHKISWWWFGWKSKYWTKDKYTHWYYLHDNGNDGHNFWEKSGGVYQSTLGLVKHK